MNSKCCCNVLWDNMVLQDNTIGAEFEGIPQLRPQVPAAGAQPQIQRRVKGCYMDCSCFHTVPPVEPKIKKLKSSRMWSDWSVNKKNGIQDESPKWYIHGYPYCRPGPAYGWPLNLGILDAAPQFYCCHRQKEFRPLHSPKAFIIDYCTRGDKCRAKERPRCGPDKFTCPHNY